jgi:hypothetical protein
MKHHLCGLLLGAGSVIGFAFLGPVLWAGDSSGGDVVELGKLKARVPADWVERVPNDPQCLKRYRLEPINDDKDNAFVSVYCLSKGKASPAAEYVQRWKGMFLPPRGQPLNEAAKVRHFTVSGAPVTLLDVQGDYKGIPGDSASVRQNCRLFGAYFDTQEGAHVIQLLGPAATVGFYSKGFENWVKAFK